VANEADSVLWTYKAYFRAADFYARMDRLSDYAIFWVSGVLAFGLVWNEFPHYGLVALAILTASLSAFRRMIDPGAKAKDYYKAANSHHRLFDEFLDYINLELADEDTGLEAMEDRFETLANRHRDLNQDNPELTDYWYRKLDDSIYDEISTTEKAKEELTGKADLAGSDKSVDSGVKEELTGDAEFDEESGDEE